MPSWRVIHAGMVAPLPLPAMANREPREIYSSPRRASRAASTARKSARARPQDVDWRALKGPAHRGCAGDRTSVFTMPRAKQRAMPCAKPICSALLVSVCLSSTRALAPRSEIVVSRRDALLGVVSTVAAPAWAFDNAIPESAKCATFHQTVSTAGQGLKSRAELKTRLEGHQERPI